MRDAPIFLVGLLPMAGYAGQRIQPLDVSGVEHGTPQWRVTEASPSTAKHSENGASQYHFDIKLGIPEWSVGAHGALDTRHSELVVLATAPSPSLPCRHSVTQERSSR